MRLLLFISLIWGTVAFADSMTINQGGVTYDCTSRDSGSGGSGYESCWTKCPWTFDSCASSCGGGSECWSKCPWTFDSCAKSCGSNVQALSATAVIDFLKTQSQRVANEKAK